jgi:sugar phosphate isomerase/epimerase
MSRYKADMKFGCCVNIGLYDELVRSGYDFIELSGSDIYNMDEDEFNNVKSIIAKGTVKCSGFNAFLKPGVKVVGREVDSAAVEEYVDKVLCRGGALGIETIGFGSPASRMIPPGFPKDRAVEQIIEFIEMVCKKAGHYGIRVLLEPLSRIETNFINNIDEALAVLKHIESENKGLLLDLYHFCLEKEHGERLDIEVGKCLYHVHIAEVTGRTYLVPSRFNVYAGLIKSLKDIGYNGRISIEANYRDYKKDSSVSLNILKEIDNQQ